jgi:subtilisin family serine protease
MPTYNVTMNNPDYNLSQNYDYACGTSMASPMVAGAAAVVWSKNPSWTAAQVEERLEKTAKPLPGLQLGAGRIDLFEAVFNGSFELDDLSEWTKSGTVSSLTSLGPLVPQDRNGHKNRMGYVSTGPSSDYVSSRLSQTFTIQSGVTSIPISFDYNFVTEEYPEWVGTIFDDKLLITLKTPSGNTVELARETVNTSSFTAIGGIDFPGGDNTVGMTGWKPKTVNVPVTEGEGTYEIFIQDAGDDIYDSVVLIDNIRFK